MASNLDELAALFSDELLRGNSGPVLDFLDDASAWCPSSPSSPTGLTTLQEDVEPFTTDDLAVLSDLLGLVAASGAPETSAQSSSTASSLAVTEQGEPKFKASCTSAMPKRRGRKRRREADPWTLASGLPAKSQQQRQRLEIGCLKEQVVELEATIERLEQRKMERERLASAAQQQEQQQSDADDAVPEPPSVLCAPLWEGVATHQVLAVHELQRQNEKLRDQVATHVEELRKLERVARARYLAEASDKTKRQKLESHKDAVGLTALVLDVQRS